MNKALLFLSFGLCSFFIYSQETFDIGLPNRRDYQEQQKAQEQKQNEEELGSQFLNSGEDAPKGQSEPTKGGKIEPLGEGRPIIPYDRTLLTRYENAKYNFQFFYPSPTVALRLETKEVAYRLNVYDVVKTYNAYRKKRKDKSAKIDYIKLFKEQQPLPNVAEGKYLTIENFTYYKTRNLSESKSEYETIFFMSKKKLFSIELHGRMGGSDLFMAWQTILGSLKVNYKHVAKEGKLEKEAKYQENKDRYKQEDLEYKKYKKQKKAEKKAKKKAEKEAKHQAKLAAKAEKERLIAEEEAARKELGLDKKGNKIKEKK